MRQNSSRTAVAGLSLLGLSVAVAWMATPRAEVGAQPWLPAHLADTLSADSANSMIVYTCRRCHGNTEQRGNMSLAEFDVGDVTANLEVAEKMVRKLRAGMMPPAGARRPSDEELQSLAVSLEARLDAAALANPDPGHRTFQRLTRSEYERTIEALLGLTVDAAAFLPPETMSHGFDNIADVQTLSPTLLDAYLTAASEISRLALGDPEAVPAEASYPVTRYASQRDHVEGAPFGTRGGIAVDHVFVADGAYVFRISFQHESTGNFFGQTAPFEEQIEISVDGERRALLDIDRFMHVSDPNGVTIETEPITIAAGEHRVAAAFLRRFEGPIEDLISPHEWSLADKKIGYSYGITSLPHLRQLVIRGPYDPSGVSETASRRRILTCRPASPAEARPCARAILARIGSEAFRRPLAEADLEALLTLYDEGAEAGGFEAGIRLGLQGVLASPDFVFRLEEPGAAVADGLHRITDLDLATRLSFFLWGAAPDTDLIERAADGGLREEDALRAEVERMLEDPRSEALATRFAAQWLRLQDLDKVHPDALMFPDFDQQLADAMRRETELFFNSLVAEDRSLLELFTADYTFVSERLARHYGIPGVAGPEFRRVAYADEHRRGIFGHGSVLTLTSHAMRTSPVLRGKWVMEVLLGTPPPPPPPDVPDLDATAEAEEGRLLTVRERMEQHRSNPACNSCHRVIDPIGLALENFDVTGRWRIKDNGAILDTRGELYDGTPIESPADLRQALLKRPEPLVRTFTENLMAYALGRRIEAFDQPTIRRITRAAAADGYRMSTFVLGVVESPAFQLTRVGGQVAEETEGTLR